MYKYNDKYYDSEWFFPSSHANIELLRLLNLVFSDAKITGQ